MISSHPVSEEECLQIKIDVVTSQVFRYKKDTAWEINLPVLTTIQFIIWLDCVFTKGNEE